MSKIKQHFAKLKENLNTSEGRKDFIKKSFKFLPATLLLIAYIVLICTDKYDVFSILLMAAFIILLYIIPAVKLSSDKKKLKVFKLCAFFGAPPIIFLVVEALTRDNFWGAPGSFVIALLNILFYYIVEFLVISITTRSDIAIIVTVTIPSILGIANNLSIQARDLPIYPWDILSAGTALNVVDNYEMVLTPTLKLCVFLIIAIIIIAIQLGMRFKFKKLWLGIFPIIASVTMLCGYVSFINHAFETEDIATEHGFYPLLFNPKRLYTYNGTPITFIYTLKYLDVEPPTGYDPENIEELYKEYESAAKDDYAKKSNQTKPNVIIIMNETFSDLSILGDLPTNKDYMPYIHSLIEENRVIHGQTLVSVKGGNTPNSEFEFLTGGSMAFLPAESIPYQQFIKGQTYSIVSQMNDLGYRTIGMHNFHRNGWKRDTIYDLLEFDEKYFLDDMQPLDDTDYIRSYMSDRAMYNEIIELYENGTDEPLFLFGVTMQNHGGYKNDKNKSFVPEIKIQYENTSDSTDLLNNYLSLIYESDKAYEEFINYFSNVDEPTVIVMFGDHQPADVVTEPIFANNPNNDQGTLEARAERYKTPYLIWANYDLNEEADAPSYMSLNYFGGVVMDVAGIPLTPFQLWQKELLKAHPAVNAFSYTDSSGNLYATAGIDSVPMLNKFSQIQYNFLFDTKHTVKEFFLPVAP